MTKLLADVPDRSRSRPNGRGTATPEQRFRVHPSLLGSLYDGDAFLIAQRRAHLFRVPKRCLPEQMLWPADEMLHPTMKVERFEPLPVTPPRQTRLDRSIDW